jgi:hypothetical protein
MCVYGIFKLDTKENFIAHRWKNIRKGSEYAYIEYVSCPDRKISEKGSEYAYIEYLNWTQKRILCHTLIEKYRKGNEYAYRIYELDTRKILCHTDRKISKG